MILVKNTYDSNACFIDVWQANYHTYAILRKRFPEHRTFYFFCNESVLENFFSTNVGKSYLGEVKICETEFDAILEEFENSPEWEKVAPTNTQKCYTT